MSDERAEREAAAQAILADARARAGALAHPGVRVNMLSAAERRAERVRAGLAPVSSGCWAGAARAARPGKRSALVSRDLRDTDGAPRPTTRRSCIRCRRVFDSHGPGNRMCEPCRARSADASPYAV